MLEFAAPTWPGCPPRRWQAEAFAAVARHYAAADPEPAVISAIMGSGKSLLIHELCATVRLRPGEAIVVSTPTEMLVEDLHHDVSRRCRMSRSVGTWYGRRKCLGDVIVACLPSVPALSAKLRAAGRRVALWIGDEVHRAECRTILDDFQNLAPVHSLGLTATPFRADLCEAITLFDSLIYRYGVAEAQREGVVCPWRIVHAPQGGDLDTICLDMVAGAQGPGLANAGSIEDAEAFAAFLSARGIAARAVHSQQHPRVRRKVLAELLAGDIKVAVHVNLLAEGANFPWLRWLLLRRPVDSRVRFVQEIGRLLRSCPGKAEAVFYDPHDLFATFRLGYAEALGEPPEKPEWEGTIDPETAAARVREAEGPVAMAWIESVIRTLAVACDAAEIMGPRRTISRAEKLKPSSELQQAALRSAVAGAGDLIPSGWRACLAAVAGRPDGIRFGFAADLLATLEGVTRNRRWPPVDGQGRISAGAETHQSEPPPYPSVEGRGGQLHIDVDALCTRA